MNITKSPDINYLWAGLIIEELVRNGVEYFCIAPGSRSSALTLAAASHKKAQTLVHIDERGSAFRALGIVSSTRKPVVVITTSGSAVANLFPAVIEASKKKLPLIILTADRPPELRFTGAHQTIDQVKIFSNYVQWQFDMPCPTGDIAPEFVLTTIDQAISKAHGELKGPIHLNCMFREPLTPITTEFNTTQYLSSMKPWIKDSTPYTTYHLPQAQLSSDDYISITSKIKKIKQGIIVVGKLSTDKEKENVLELSEKLNWPIFADISSGVRLNSTHKNVIHYFDQILLSKTFAKKYKVDGVIHIGGRITSKRWYEFIEEIAPQEYLMVINHSLRNDPLHNVTTRVHCTVSSFCAMITKQLSPTKNKSFLTQMQKLNSDVAKRIEEFFIKNNDLSEPLVARLISQEIPENTGLFVSNSMPIRDMDMYAMPGNKNIVFEANRGASGIDGIIATSIGFAQGLQKPTTLLIGDVAFLHDLNSLMMLRDLKKPLIIVVLNNNGGGIFSFLPIAEFSQNFEKVFGTPHNLRFHAMAEMLNINYASPKTYQEFVSSYRIALKSNTSTIFEINTNRAYNFELHKKMELTNGKKEKN